MRGDFVKLVKKVLLEQKSDAEQEIRRKLPEIVKAAQKEYDEWDQDGDGYSEELGSGGICDRIQNQIGDILSGEGFDVIDGGQEGDDHAFLFATKNGESFSVDIHPSVYETGGGYSWKKKPGVIFKSEHVDIYPANYEDIYGEPYQEIEEEEDYRGEHSAPDSSNGKPLHDLTDIYPDDIYSYDAARLYGDEGGSARDRVSISIIQGAKGRPHKPVKIYRAVPKNMSTSEKIQNYELQKKYILKTGKTPKDADRPEMNSNQYFEYIYGEIEKLKELPPENESKITINSGDWVTINKEYAVDHGKSALNGKYKILSKTVKAKNLYTDGNSIHEFGFDAF